MSELSDFIEEFTDSIQSNLEEASCLAKVLDKSDKPLAFTQEIMIRVELRKACLTIEQLASLSRKLKSKKF